MSVLHENKHGWILDHQKSIKDTYRNVMCDLIRTDFTLKQELFNINVPFMTDSQFKALAQKKGIACGATSTSNEALKIKKRKRKRNAELNEGEQRANDFHIHVITTVLSAYKSLLKDTDIFKTAKDECDNNVTARQLSVNLGPGDMLRNMCSTSLGIIGTLTLKSGDSYKDVSNQLVSNNEDTPVMVKIMDGLYLIPPKSSFVMADTRNLKLFTDILGKFNLIILDPPWENKSVKRKKMYWTLSNEDLLMLPVPELSAPDCIIGMWVTNRVKHIEFIIKELFPKWKISYITTWYWLKVTKYGEMVYNIESQHKKPYELLILGRHRSTDSVLLPDVPLDKTIISIPSSLHSMKIPLHDILTPYLPPNPKCLEVFARNLQNGWFSIGNEVFKHQHIDYFEKT